MIASGLWPMVAVGVALTWLGLIVVSLLAVGAAARHDARISRTRRDRKG